MESFLQSFITTILRTLLPSFLKHDKISFTRYRTYGKAMIDRTTYPLFYFPYTSKYFYEKTGNEQL